MIGPPKFRYWYREACRELGIKPIQNQRQLIFPKSFYENIEKLSKEKLYDFVFIGSLKVDNATFKNRKWILPFITKYFNENSYLQFTDNKTKKNYDSKGVYDYTLIKPGFVPKQNFGRKLNYFDENYFKKMCNSKFCLCPAGDVHWSYRFFESLICKTIPIVDKECETYINLCEKEFGYKYYLTSSPEFVYREDWVEYNYNLFMKHHTLVYTDISNLQKSLISQKSTIIKKPKRNLKNMFKPKNNGFMIH